jgi:hypothetical protein
MYYFSSVIKNKTMENLNQLFANQLPSIYKAIEHVKNLDLIQFVPYEHHAGEPYYSATFEYQEEIDNNWLTIEYYALYTQFDFETGDYKLIDFQIVDANLMHEQEVLIDKKGLMPYINIPTIE